AKPAPLEERRDVVDANGFAATTGGSDGGVPASRRNIEDAPPGLEVCGLTQVLGLKNDPRGDNREIAARPGFLLAGFYRGEVGSGEGSGCGCGANVVGLQGFLMRS